MRSRRPGFTLIELLIAVTLMVLAITITLFATIGTNSLIERTEQRASLVQGTRETVDTLRRSLSNVSVRNIALIKEINYTPPTSDLTFSLSRATYGTTEEGFAIEIRRFGTAQRDNVCQLFGRAEVKKDSNGVEQFFLSSTGSQMAILVYKMNTAGLCEYSTALYRGTLTGDDIEVTNFKATIIPVDYSCGSDSCSVGQLRYRIGVETLTFAENKKSAIDSSGSVALLKEHKNIAATLSGISFDPVGPFTLSTGGTQALTLRAGYSDGSFQTVTSSADASYVVTPVAGGTFNKNTGIFTAGSTPGLYQLQATYQSKTAMVEITVQGVVPPGPTLQSISLAPTNPCVPSGGSLAFTVTGHYSDSSTSNLTNSASYTLLAPVQGSMVFNTYQAAMGTYTVQLRASYSSFQSNTATITVQASCGGTIDPDPEPTPGPGPGPTPGGGL